MNLETTYIDTGPETWIEFTTLAALTIKEEPKPTLLATLIKEINNGTL
jgi:hypothetical protein